MNTHDFTTTLLVDQSPEQAFYAINDVRGWWSEEIEGNTGALNEEFDYHFQDIHRCRIKIIEVKPFEKIVWRVLDNYFKFTVDTTEWIGTEISFEISQAGSTTQIQFTHHGLVPEYECYEICRDAWTAYIQHSLRELITTGVGLPNGEGKLRTIHEQQLSTQGN